MHTVFFVTSPWVRVKCGPLTQTHTRVVSRVGNSMPVWNQIGDDRWLLEPKAYGIRYILYYSNTNYLKNKLVIRIGLNHTTPTSRSGNDSANYPTQWAHTHTVFCHESMGERSNVVHSHWPIQGWWAGWAILCLFGIKLGDDGWLLEPKEYGTIRTMI